jgi:hypothetical protein
VAAGQHAGLLQKQAHEADVKAAAAAYAPIFPSSNNARALQPDFLGMRLSWRDCEDIAGEIGGGFVVLVDKQDLDGRGEARP